MRKKKSFKQRGSMALATLLCIVCSYPSYAGFSFNTQPPAPALEEKQDTVVPSVMPDVVVPTIENPRVAREVLPSVVTTPMVSERPLLPIEVQVFQGEIVDGFGSGIPLVIAVRQIVPARYGFVFGDSLDLGMKIDWQGGRPWNQILEDLGSRYGFEVKIKNKVVMIETASVVMDNKKTAIDDEFNAPVPSMPVSIVTAPEITEPAQPMPEIDPVINKKIMVEDVPVEVVKSQVIAPTVLIETNNPPIVNKQPFLINDSGNIWFAQKNQTLRTTLQGWADAHNVSLVWNSEYDYPIQADVNIVGGFENAVRNLLDGFATADPKPLGKLYMNKVSGSPVLVVESARISQ